MRAPAPRSALPAGGANLSYTAAPLQTCLTKKDAVLREIKAFEDSVGVQLEAGAHAVEENVGRSAAVTESKLRELADAQARAPLRRHFQTAACVSHARACPRGR